MFPHGSHTRKCCHLVGCSFPPFPGFMPKHGKHLEMAKGLDPRVPSLLDLPRVAIIKAYTSFREWISRAVASGSVLCNQDIHVFKTPSFQPFSYTIMYLTSVSFPRLCLCLDALSSMGIDPRTAHPSGAGHYLTVSQPPVLVTFSLTSLVCSISDKSVYIPMSSPPTWHIAQHLEDVQYMAVDWAAWVA